MADKDWKCVFAKDASLGEKAAAYSVTNAMKLKSKFGTGLKKKPTTTLAKASKSTIFSNNSRKVIQAALRSARDAVKKAGGKANVHIAY